ncbi:MAG TPA: Sjogren's syndrome/scleroderma autoantigen 1 family protein [Halobacteriales archaeon]|nr:Sjogren's syndrome/scleroderma autoantigen 1 family protein [Halobacteriales archaeon]
MSDTEDEGAFDKEAEKEKLRAQLEREEEERQSTQHMSELLLKGATMTNKHCDVCGDPIFRYDGQEFCPTCSQAGEAGAEGAPAGEPSTEGGASVETAEGAEGIDRVDTGTGAETPGADAATPSQTTAPSVATPQRAAPRATGDAGEDVAAARAALARKLSTLAAQAEATDDVGRARELLAAAREAAEALAAIEDLGG